MTGKQLWEKLEKESKVKIDNFKVSNQHTVKFTSNYIGYAVLSDVHLGGSMVDYKQAKHDAKLISKTKNAYAIIGGDITDNFIQMKKVQAVMESTTTIEQQIKVFEYYLGLFDKSIIGMISGNHNAWTKELSGFDIWNYIAGKNGIFYSPHDLLLTFDVGKQEYVMYLRHKYRFKSSYNQTHSVKQMFRFSKYDFDIGMLEHYHEPESTTFIYKGKKCAAIANGSYKAEDDYARKVGYDSSPVTQHFIIISKSKRSIKVFDSIEEGTDYLDFLNKKK